MQGIFLKFACMCRIYRADVEADWLAFSTVFVSEGRPFLVRYRRGWFLSEQEAGREDGTLGKVRPDSVCVCVWLWFWGHFMHMLVLVPWSQKVPQLFLLDSNESKLSLNMCQSHVSICSGPRFEQTSAVIMLPDDCTVGFIVERRLGISMVHSNMFHSHLENLLLLAASDIPKQVRFLSGGC